MALILKTDSTQGIQGCGAIGALICCWWGCILLQTLQKTVGSFPKGSLIIVVVVQSSCCVWLFVTPWTAAHQASVSLTISQSLPRFMSISVIHHINKMTDSCPLHRWCHPAISSSDTLFSFCLQSFPVSGTFQMSQIFESDNQNTGISTSASALPMSSQSWFPLRLTSLISLRSKGHSGVFSSTMVWRC